MVGSYWFTLNWAKQWWWEAPPARPDASAHAQKCCTSKPVATVFKTRTWLKKIVYMKVLTSRYLGKHAYERMLNMCMFTCICSLIGQNNKSLQHKKVSNIIVILFLLLLKYLSSRLGKKIMSENFHLERMVMWAQLVGFLLMTMFGRSLWETKVLRSNCQVI